MTNYIASYLDACVNKDCRGVGSLYAGTEGTSTNYFCAISEHLNRFNHTALADRLDSRFSRTNIKDIALAT